MYQRIDWQWFSNSEILNVGFVAAKDAVQKHPKHRQSKPDATWFTPEVISDFETHHVAQTTVHGVQQASAALVLQPFQTVLLGG